MSKQQPRKPIKWVGSAKHDLDAMPEDVKEVFGHAIDLAQAGQRPPAQAERTADGDLCQRHQQESRRRHQHVARAAQHAAQTAQSHQTLGNLLKLDPNPGRTHRVLV